MSGFPPHFPTGYSAYPSYPPTGFPAPGGFPPQAGFPAPGGFPPQTGFPAPTGFPPAGFPQAAGFPPSFPQSAGFPQAAPSFPAGFNLPQQTGYSFPQTGFSAPPAGIYPQVPGSARPLDVTVTVPEVVMDTITITRKVPKQVMEQVEISFQAPVMETKLKTEKRAVTKLVDQDVTYQVTKTFQLINQGPSLSYTQRERSAAPSDPPAGYVHKPPADDTIST